MAPPLHTEVGLVEDRFQCGYCGEIIERPKFKDIQTVIDQHITYHCEEVGLLHADLPLSRP